MPDLRVTLGALTLANPVLVAAGTFGYGLEFAATVPLDRLGALITKTLTRQPREGNPPPRLVETPSGLLNSVGLQNAGLDPFLRDTLPALRPAKVPVIVSILGDSEEDVAAMVQRLDREDGVAAIELNLSCPNVNHAAHSSKFDMQSSELHRTSNIEHRTPMVAQDPALTEAMVRAARAKTAKPLIAKLSPDETDLAPRAQAAERAGASALTVGNTFTGMSLDPTTRRSRLGAMTGGLSGPAIRPLAVYRVWYTARSVRLPIIGTGGIVRAEDALEFFLAGASAVAVGTANFADPRTPLRVARGLERYLARQGIASIGQLHGTLQT
ncbi:MAG: dihydroorotate dehydrogenase [Candidatus Omnitrophica bacterium]|nr:dihydroorotate dehydrogenase [Candidatus Omnitrophota bacterium]